MRKSIGLLFMYACVQLKCTMQIYIHIYASMHKCDFMLKAGKCFLKQ